MSSARGRWLAAWPGAAALGVANGALRELTFGRLLGAERANRASVATLIAALAVYMRLLQRRWPLEDREDGLAVGAAWTTLTVGFEFGLGRLQGESWEDLLAAYDVTEGRLWPLVLAWVAAGPEVVRRLSSPRTSASRS